MNTFAATGRTRLKAQSRLDPGHQFEWVWLLDRYTKLTGIPTPERDTIFEFALAHGSDPADNLVYEEIDLAFLCQTGSLPAIRPSSLAPALP